MESSRRQQAQADLGMNFAKEDQKREASCQGAGTGSEEGSKAAGDDEHAFISHHGEDIQVHG